MDTLSRPVLPVVVTLFLASSPHASAHEADLIEHIFGATNVHAIAGAGGLTIGVSKDGDLSVLTWPSPSYTDHLSYITSNGEDARTLPRFGASEGMGAFAGIVYSTDSGTTLAVSWLRSSDWSGSVTYASPRSSLIVTTRQAPTLGLSVIQTDFVDEIDDVWVRRIDVTREPSSPVTDAWVLLYANLTPTLSRVPEAPVADWAFEAYNDFAALYDPSAGIVLHFHPGDTGVVTGIFDILGLDKDYGPIGEALAAADPVPATTVDALVADIDVDYAAGVYLALGSVPAPDGWQVGFDATDLCGPLDTLAKNFTTLEDRYAGLNTGGLGSVGIILSCSGGIHPGARLYNSEDWVATAEDALADAVDGVLSGSRIAAGHVNEALRVPLSFAPGPGGDVAAATFYLAAGATAAEARAALAAVQAVPSDALADATALTHETWLAALALPDAPGIDPRIVDFSARTLLNLRVGTDRGTAALVASITRQPPYGEDWPRDGSFFNAALDVAGLTDLVTERLRFYASLQRDEPVYPTPFVDEPGPGYPDDPGNITYPADSWEMNYYADGLVGGNIRWEIDNTALLVWSFVSHAGYIADDTERIAYLEEVYPTIRRAADLLVYWRDPQTLLPWKANEDDRLDFTQGLQGAGTVFGALRSAAMAARALGETDDARSWEYRAAEVRWAIETHLYEEGIGFLVEKYAENPGSSATGASSWLAWPAKAFGADDPRLLAQLEANMDEVLYSVAGNTAGGAYLTKTSLATVLVHPDPGERDRALELATAMVDIADSDTLYLGEVFVSLDDDGDGVTDRFDNRVATPHLWAAALVYLTLMAYHHPERFDLHEEVLPPAEIPDEIETPDGMDAGTDGGTTIPGVRGGGCGCRVAGSPDTHLPGFLVLVLVLLRRRGRKTGE